MVEESRRIRRMKKELPPANEATHMTRKAVWYCNKCESFKTYTHGSVFNAPKCCGMEMSLRQRKDFEL